MFIIQGADGKEYGPVTTGHVGEWIRDGRANLSTKARRDDETVWKPLGQFEEFRSGPSPAVPSAPLMLPVAPPAAVVETIPANLWLRLPAALIDGFLKTLCFLPTTIPVTRVLLEQAAKGGSTSLTEIAAVTKNVLNTSLEKSLPLLAALLLVQMGLLALRGQSVGKLIVGLRIVRLDGSAPGFLHAFLLRSCIPFLLEQIPVLGLVFWVVDSCFIFRDDHRCLHDLLAGTRVVRKTTAG